MISRAKGGVNQYIAVCINWWLTNHFAMNQLQFTNKSKNTFLTKSTVLVLYYLCSHWHFYRARTRFIIRTTRFPSKHEALNRCWADVGLSSSVDKHLVFAGIVKRPSNATTLVYFPVFTAVWVIIEVRQYCMHQSENVFFVCDLLD